MRLLVGFDLGTTALKGVILSEDGELLNSRVLPVEYDYSEKGKVEFSAEVYYQNFCSLTRELVRDLPAGTHLMAVSLSGATGNTLLLDSNNSPLHKAISWLDSRNVEDAPFFDGQITKEEVYKIAGWPYLGIFPLAHLIWLKYQLPGIFHSAARYLLNISYLYFRLTGKFVTDPSTATTFYLQDQRKRCWYSPFLERLGISRSGLPVIKPSGTIVGGILPRAAAETGLSEDVRVVLGSFDHPAAARGAGVLKAGEMLLSCGTSWVGFYPVEERQTGIRNHLLVDPFLSPAGPWAGMFSLPALGKKIDMLIGLFTERDHHKYKIFNLEAANSPPGANQVNIAITAPPDQLLSSVKKLAERVFREDIFRAVMEAAAFEIKRKMDYLEGSGLKAEEITMVGGAAESRLWPQIIADVTGKPVRVGHGQMTGALGSAIMAGTAMKIFRDEKEGAGKINGGSIVLSPEFHNKGIYESSYQMYLKKILLNKNE